MKQSQPNLLYVFADQVCADAVGYAGNPFVKTPNIDRFRSEGVLFTNTVSATPVCAAYRASLFTGKYSSSTGMAINEIRMNPNHRCIGHVVGEDGYEQAYIGKWHLWATDGRHRVMENHFVPPGPDRLGFDGYWASYGFWHHYYEAFYFEDDFVRHDVDGYEPDVQTDLAIGQLTKFANQDTPFSIPLFGSLACGLAQPAAILAASRSECENIALEASKRLVDSVSHWLRFGACPGDESTDDTGFDGAGW